MSLLPTQFHSLTLKIESKFSFQAREDSVGLIGTLWISSVVHTRNQERGGKRKNVALLASLYVV